MPIDTLYNLSQTDDRRVPINATVRESTLLRLNALVSKAQDKNPDTNRSQITDRILSEKLDELNIPG